MNRFMIALVGVLIVLLIASCCSKSENNTPNNTNTLAPGLHWVA